MEGLEYLHNFSNLKLIHGDVKIANILLNNKMEAKLSDFGISRPILTGGLPRTKVLGTQAYLDPE
jgi:serine/threonine protein kinase